MSDEKKNYFLERGKEVVEKSSITRKKVIESLFLKIEEPDFLTFLEETINSKEGHFLTAKAINALKKEHSEIMSKSDFSPQKIKNEEEKIEEEILTDAQTKEEENFAVQKKEINEQKIEDDVIKSEPQKEDDDVRVLDPKKEIVVNDEISKESEDKSQVLNNEVDVPQVINESPENMTENISPEVSTKSKIKEIGNEIGLDELSPLEKDIQGFKKFKERIYDSRIARSLSNLFRSRTEPKSDEGEMALKSEEIINEGELATEAPNEKIIEGEIIKVTEGIKEMPEENRRSLGEFLMGNALLASKETNKFFGGVFSKLGENMKEGTFRQNVILAFRDRFKGNEKQVQNRIKDLEDGKHRFVSNSGYIMGGLITYGRILGDMVGNYALPTNQFALIAKTFSSAYGVAKESLLRFNLGIQQKTELELGNREELEELAKAAAEEAWNIYYEASPYLKSEEGAKAFQALEEDFDKKNLQLESMGSSINPEKFADRQKLIVEIEALKEEMNRLKPSSSQLSRIYRDNLPKDILARFKRGEEILANDAVATDMFIEGEELSKAIKLSITERAIRRMMQGLENKLLKIENDPSLTDNEKEKKKVHWLGLAEKHLVDIDRMVTQNGEVLGMAKVALYAKVLESGMRGVSNVLAFETMGRVFSSFWTNGVPWLFSESEKFFTVIPDKNIASKIVTEAQKITASEESLNNLESSFNVQSDRMETVNSEVSNTEATVAGTIPSEKIEVTLDPNKIEYGEEYHVEPKHIPIDHSQNDDEIKVESPLNTTEAKVDFNEYPISATEAIQSSLDMNNLSSEDFKFNEQFKILTAEQGDSVWSLSRKQLTQQFGEAFTTLTEKEQNSVIATLKNAIGAQPENFGLAKGMNIEREYLPINSKIDFGAFFNNKENLAKVFETIKRT